MELRNALIYGFGKWVDFEIDFSNHVFTCIYGENEAGKSTLHKFILFMLFGLPPKERTFYQPKTSSKMGGRLTVFDSDVGEFIIERFDHVNNGAAVCYLENGEQYDETWLQNRYKGMSANTYQDIFSFSAMDLQHIKNMRENEISDVLLSMGLTGSPYIHSMEKKLDQQLGELFKPYGKLPKINQQLDVLDDLQQSLSKYKEEESSYLKKKDHVMDMENELQQLKMKLHATKEKRIFIGKKLQALPQIQQYVTYKKQLSNLPSITDFPEDGLERLEKLKHALLPIYSERNVIQNNVQNYLKRIQKIKLDLDELVPSNEAEYIRSKKQSYVETMKEIDEKRKKIHKRNIQMESELTELNIGLSMKDLETVYLPFHVEKTWNTLKREYEQLQSEKEQLIYEKQILTKNDAYIATQIKQKQKRMMSNEEKARFQGLLKEYEEYGFKHQLQEETLMWEKDKKETLKQSKLVLNVSTLISIASIFLGTYFKAEIFYYLAILIMVFGIGQFISQRKASNQMAKMFKQMYANIPDIQITSEEKDRAIQLLAEDQEKRAEYHSLKEQLRAIDIQNIQWEEKNHSLIQKEESLSYRIHNECKNYPFLNHVDIQFWPECYHIIKNILRIYHEKQEMEQECRHALHHQQSIQDEISIMIDKFKEKKIEINGGSNVEELFQRIENNIEIRQKKEEQLYQLEQLVEEERKHLLEINEKIATFEKEIEILFTHANVDNEETFYQKGNVVQKRHEILGMMDNIDSQFSTVFSENEWNQFMEETPNESILEMEDEQVNMIIKNLEEEIEQKRQQIAEINADLRQMEGSESHSTLSYQFYFQKEKLHELARNWYITKTAKEMLVQTKKNFTDKYLNKVIIQTSKYFKELTGSTYIKVHLPSNNGSIVVETKDRLKYTVNELSKGTMDQLYVSLRLAMSEVMAKEYKLPFIIDDAFVHYDIVRMGRMMSILKKISEQQQIILLTCRKEIASIPFIEHMINLANPVRIMP